MSSSLNFSTEYNPNYKQITSLSLSARINQPRVTLQAGWSRWVQLAESQAARTPPFDTLRGSGKFVLWPERVTLEGSATYDVLQKLMLQSTARLKYSIQCCGFAVEQVKYNTRYRQDSKTTFQIELGGIGSIGSFMGDNPASQNNAGRK